MYVYINDMYTISIVSRENVLNRVKKQVSESCDLIVLN